MSNASIRRLATGFALVVLAAFLIPVGAQAATTRTLVEVWDASDGAEPIGGWEGYAAAMVTGDPRTSPWPAWNTTPASSGASDPPGGSTTSPRTTRTEESGDRSSPA